MDNALDGKSGSVPRMLSPAFLFVCREAWSPYLRWLQGLLWRIDLAPTPNWRGDASSDVYSLRVSSADEPDGSRIVTYCTGALETAVPIVRAAMLLAWEKPVKLCCHCL